jgi:hypothetical protein
MALSLSVYRRIRKLLLFYLSLDVLSFIFVVVDLHADLELLNEGLLRVFV